MNSIPPREPVGADLCLAAVRGLGSSPMKVGSFGRANAGFQCKINLDGPLYGYEGGIIRFELRIGILKAKDSSGTYFAPKLESIETSPRHTITIKLTQHSITSFRWKFFDRKDLNLAADLKKMSESWYPFEIGLKKPSVQGW